MKHPEQKPRAEQRPEPEATDLDQLAQHVEQMNKTAKALQSSLRFEVITKNRIAIRVINDDTGEVLREIPSKALIEALKSMERTMGMLLDEKV